MLAALGSLHRNLAVQTVAGTDDHPVDIGVQQLVIIFKIAGVEPIRHLGASELIEIRNTHQFHIGNL